MKTWILAALLAAACASADPASQPASAANASAAGASAAPSYTDARSAASDAEVRDARRAYRAACQQRHQGDYCECMTGGMAQALSPADLNVATAILSGTAAQATSETRSRVESVRAQVDSGCAQYRRG